VREVRIYHVLVDLEPKLVLQITVIENRSRENKLLITPSNCAGNCPLCEIHLLYSMVLQSCCGLLGYDSIALQSVGTAIFEENTSFIFRDTSKK
jgi:hypothetical protein